MISFIDLENNIKKNKFENCYILCGMDENLIKKSINSIIEKNISDDFKDLNFSKFDGTKINPDDIINACETIPFMSEKRVVLVYRSTFLQDSNGNSNEFKLISDYISNIPEHCILIMYYVFESDRDKPSSKVKKLDKKVCGVKVDKLKGDLLHNKVKELFESKNKKIGKTELSLFCNQIDNNMEIISNEVEKLSCYTYDRDITKEDIIAMMPQKSENDIFDLVDSLSQKNVKRALDILNELLYRGEKTTYILYMIERQFKLLLNLRLGIDSGKSKEVLASELKLHPYICEKMMAQSRKFTLKQIKNSLELCVETEVTLKSSSTDDKVNMEVFMINTLVNK